MTRPFDFSQAANTGISILPALPPLPNAGDIISVANTNGGRVQLTYTPISTGGTGPFLPLAGGTMLGPLNYIATGSTTARSAQDRAADVANVLDYGADPTGVADSTAAFNAAAAVVASGSTRHKAVYFPTGVYRINGQINLTACQEFYGDSRGSSVLQVDQAFSSSATSVLFLTALFYPLGPYLHDFSINFAQPQDQSSRANFKTLAEGGTSSAGGTGVKYPWAIASGDNNFRIQIARVQIGGAWDGITSNNHNTVFWLDDIEMGALNCGLSLGEGAGGSAGILDFCHITAYHFWNFGISNSQPLFAMFCDGNTIAMRVGRVDALEIKSFNSFRGRLIVTPDTAGHGSIHIGNCIMDTDQSTIEINGGMLQFSIANLSGTAGIDRPRPFFTAAASVNVNIANYYSHSTSNFPDFSLTHAAANVNITNFRTVFYTTNIPWVEVQSGKFRATHGNLYLQGPRTVAAISETSAGNLFIDDVWVDSNASSGPLISAVGANAVSMIGRIQLNAGHAWTFTLPAAMTQTTYSPVANFTGNVFAPGFFANSVVQLGKTVAGSPGTVAIYGAAGEQRGILLKRAALNGWGVLVQGATDDLNIGRWNDAGAFQGNALSLIRATGAATFSAGVGVFGTAPPAAKPAVTGAKGSNAALASLLTVLASYGLLTDSTGA